MTDDNLAKLLHGSTDAADWAREFVLIHGGDEGLMLGWFANAIETGRNAGRAAVADANQRAEQAEAKRDALQAMVDGCRELVGDYHSQLTPGSSPFARGLHKELAEVVGYPEGFRALVADQPATGEDTT